MDQVGSGDMPVDPDLAGSASEERSADAAAAASDAAPDVAGVPVAGSGATGVQRRTADRPPWDVVVVIAAGGAAGGGARWAVNQMWPAQPGLFPWSTFVENVTGCLLLGALMVFLLDVWRPRRYSRPFWGVGVLGGYTTFSTYTADAAVLLRDGHAPTALVYLFGSVATGLAAAWLGLALVRTTVVRPRTGSRRRMR